jgi:glycosyltransferase involved in cell wall biosynthesis
VRILVVSAHFPPNFVSGGTLQPQRLAHGLLARGHDVSVYAGLLDAARPPLETSTTTDEHGLEVRWIVTTPFTDWTADQNWWNEEVAADFAEHVEAVRPDVVHLHSLQSLGAELVDVAKRAPSAPAVVVTAHDFWWQCGRQFLVARDGVPCCPVVAAGTCACEVSRPWLEDRNRVVAASLDLADLVLAPSAIAVQVLAANGVPAERLEVDENGIPDAIARPPQTRVADRDGPVRFTYAGGHEPLKGVHVALAAAAALHDTDGWHLTLYGAGRYVDEHRVDVSALPVRVEPAFSPADLPDVLGVTDVLLVPSIMRESHSLVTREALAAGVPVICSDCFGPEEVVVSGRNGFVVPSGDHEALAAAMRRVATDRAELAALERGCIETPVVLRSLDDQVTGLEARYNALRSSARPQVEQWRPKLVVFVAGIDGAPLRYRVHAPAEGMGRHGVYSQIHDYRAPQLREAALGADIVVLYRVPATPAVLDTIAAARARSIPVLFDVDDLIFDPSVADDIPALRQLPVDEATLWLEGVNRYRTTLEHCDGFIGSTAMLVEHAQRVTGLPAAQFDNGPPLLLSRASDNAVRMPRTPGPLRVGYLSGTTTHDEDWAFVEPAIVSVLEERPAVELWLAGHLGPTPALDRFGDRVRRLPFRDWREVPQLLRDLDVNLAPLQPGGRFNEAKSAIKWLEAALVDTATIASPTGPFRAAIRHGENGLLARDPADWCTSLRMVLDDDQLRAALGTRARRDALLRWSPALQGARYLELLDAARAWPSAVRSPREPWPDVMIDEPPRDTAFAPYEELHRRPLARRVAGRAARLIRGRAR